MQNNSVELLNNNNQFNTIIVQKLGESSSDKKN